MSVPMDSSSIQELDNAIVQTMLTAHQTPVICQVSSVRKIIMLNFCQVCTRAKATSCVPLENRACTIVRVDLFSISKAIDVHHKVAVCWTTSQSVPRMLPSCHISSIAVTTTSASTIHQYFDRALQDFCSISHHFNVIWILWLLVLPHHVHRSQFGPTKNQSEI